MKVQCSHCGHTQILRQTSRRRISEDGEHLFQCSQCHRYSPISKGVMDTQRRSEPSSPKDAWLADLIREGLIKVGIMEKPKTKEEIEEEERQKRIEEARKQYERVNPNIVWK